MSGAFKRFLMDPQHVGTYLGAELPGHGTILIEQGVAGRRAGAVGYWRTGLPRPLEAVRAGLRRVTESFERLTHLGVRTGLLRSNISKKRSAALLREPTIPQPIANRLRDALLSNHLLPCSCLWEFPLLWYGRSTVTNKRRNVRRRNPWVAETLVNQSSLIW